MEELLGECALKAIQQYADMSRILPAPEGYVRDTCATLFHKETGKFASVELPIRDFVNRWSIDRLELEILGNFRIDMAVYSSDTTNNGVDMELMIEFKLWTDRFRIANDISRLQHICRILNQGEEKPPWHRTRGFVVVCPQYHQGPSATRQALDDLERHFKYSFKKQVDVAANFGTSNKMFGVGVGVIDVDSAARDLEQTPSS